MRRQEPELRIGYTHCVRITSEYQKYIFNVSIQIPKKTHVNLKSSVIGKYVFQIMSHLF